MGGLPSQQVAIAVENLATSRERFVAVHVHRHGDDLVGHMAATWISQWSIIMNLGASGAEHRRPVRLGPQEIGASTIRSGSRPQQEWLPQHQVAGSTCER
jgi:hypothetical protein